MSRYKKVDPRVWRDEKFTSLSKPKPNAQSLWLHLLTTPLLGTLPGAIVAGRAALAEELGWPLRGFNRCFDELIDSRLS